MTVDLMRPPARLGPRIPLWIKLGVLWGILLVVTILALRALSQPLEPSGVLAFLVVFWIATLGLSYINLRSGASMSAGRLYLGARGYAVGDMEDATRPSDREEREARHLLRRKEITRYDYERIIARRRFAHGEITHPQYEEEAREIAEAELGKLPSYRPAK